MSKKAAGRSKSKVLGVAAACGTRLSLGELWGFFSRNGVGPLPRWRALEGEDLPEPQRTLLIHPHHMTVALEEHHHRPVQLRVLERRNEGDLYARRLVLTVRGREAPVMFGIMMIDLSATPPAARQEILSERTPLGAILIAHRVLRRIEPRVYLEIRPTAALRKLLHLPPGRAAKKAAPRPLYGRLATIHCAGVPAVELLEVVVP